MSVKGGGLLRLLDIRLRHGLGFEQSAIASDFREQGATAPSRIHNLSPAAAVAQ